MQFTLLQAISCGIVVGLQLGGLPSLKWFYGSSVQGWLKTKYYEFLKMFSSILHHAPFIPAGIALTNSQVPEISWCFLLSSRGHWADRERRGHHTRQEETSNRKLCSEWWCLCSSTARAGETPFQPNINHALPRSQTAHPSLPVQIRAGTMAEQSSAGPGEPLDRGSASWLVLRGFW